jgi:lipopolysaccharide export system permease protein
MLAPLIVASLGVAVAAFIFNETIVVHSARVVNAWTDNDYKPIPPERGILSNVWLSRGGDLVRARLVAGKGATFRAQGVTIYERKNGALQRIVDAERAVPQGNEWQLTNVRVYDSNMNMVRKVPAMVGLEGLTPGQLTLAKVDPDETGFVPLLRKIREMEEAGLPTAEARAGLWHKISGPLSIILMPLLAAVAAFGLARSGQVLLRASIGMALGFAYFVADNFSLAMGNVGAYPPLLAAWAPFLLFLLVGETVLIRSEE